MSRRAGALAAGACRRSTVHHGSAPHKADVAATEDVAVALFHTILGAHFAAVNLHLGLSEHITVGVERTLLAVAPDVVALATAEDVAAHVAVVHRDVGLAGFVDGRQLAHRPILFGSTAANGGYLAAAVHAVAHRAAPHRHVGKVHAATHVVAAAEDVAAVAQPTVAGIDFIYIVGLVVDLLLVVAATVADVGEVLFGRHGGEVAVTDVAVVQRQVRRAEDGTALAAGVGVALNGGHTLVEAIVGRQRGLVLAHADDHVGLAGQFRAFVVGAAPTFGGVAHRRVAHVAFPSAAVDITAGAALDVGIGRGCKVGTKNVVDGTPRASGIDILMNLAAKQGYVGSAIDIA